MLYKEFLNAARKHRTACQVLYEKIKTLDVAQTEQATQHKALTLNLYYLAGYVVECSVKYGIYKAIGYDRAKSVKQLNQNGLSYAADIKHHAFERYADHLGRVYSDLVLVSVQREVPREVLHLYKNWDVEIRYLSKELPPKFKHATNFNFVAKFYQYAEQIFAAVQRL